MAGGGWVCIDDCRQPQPNDPGYRRRCVRGVGAGTRILAARKKLTVSASKFAHFAAMPPSRSAGTPAAAIASLTMISTTSFSGVLALTRRVIVNAATTSGGTVPARRNATSAVTTTSGNTIPMAPRRSKKKCCGRGIEWRTRLQYRFYSIVPTAISSTVSNGLRY